MRRDFQNFELFCNAKVESKKTHLIVRQINNFILLILLQIFFQILFLIIFTVRIIKTEKKMPKIFVHALTKNQIYINSSTDELFQFLAEKRFPYSNVASDYLIYCKNLLLHKTSKLKVTRSFSLYLIINCFSGYRILGLSKTMIYLIVSILREKTGLNLKPSHLLYYFVEYCVWTEVNFNSKIQFITTLSAYKNLPIVFYLRKKNFERHMMWYSVNTIPIFKIGEKEPKMVLPQSLANYIDLHLVWNNYQVGFLEKQNIHNSKAYGSMLFYPKKVQENFNKNSSLIYFDVIPQHLIEKNSFYSNEMALCNLEGIISVINEFNDKFGKNLKLRIKHKRLPNKQHSAIYLNKVKNLISCGVIENVSPTENLYTLINDSKFVIAPPFTSPVFIAKELGVDCSFVYLGRTEYLIPDYFNEILVIKDKNNLLNKLVEFI